MVKGLPTVSSNAEVYAELLVAAARHGMSEYLSGDYNVLNESCRYVLVTPQFICLTSSLTLRRYSSRYELLPTRSGYALDLSLVRSSGAPVETDFSWVADAGRGL
jgi:hypothetical protein